MDKLNRWLTLFANLGIVAGLVLVAFQLTQAERYADGEQINTEFGFNLSGADTAFAEALPEAWARARLNSHDLTLVEASLVDSYLNRRMQESIIESFQASAGRSEFQLERSAIVFVIQFLGNETALRWWQYNRSFWAVYIPEFVEAIDARLLLSGPEQRTAHLRRIEAIIEGPLPDGVAL